VVLPADSFDTLKVATSVGILRLPRQMLFDHERQEHFLPANGFLPEHGGMLITRKKVVQMQAGVNLLLTPRCLQSGCCKRRQLDAVIEW
jgi:hypothetical protein